MMTGSHSLHEGYEGFRVTLEAVTAMLAPMNHDERITLLITLMAAEMADAAENDDQIDAVIAVLRKQIRIETGRPIGVHH